MEAILWRLLCRETNKSNNHQGNREISTQIKESPQKMHWLPGKKGCLHPRKLTCPLKHDSWKIMFLLTWSLFRGTFVHFRLGCHQILIPQMFSTLGRARCSKCGGLCRSLERRVFLLVLLLKGFGMGGLVCCPHPFRGFLGVPFLEKKLGVHPDLTWWSCGITSNAKNGVAAWGVKMITWHHRERVL